MLDSIKAALLLITALLSHASVALDWDLPYAGPPQGPLSRELNVFAGALAADPAANLILKPSAGGDPARILEQVRTGKVASAVVPSAMFAATNRLLAIEQVPFLTVSFADAGKLWRVVRPALESELARQGLVLLYAVPLAPKGLLGNTGVSEIAGFRTRRLLVDTPGVADFASATGATAVAGNDAQAALKSAKADLAFASASEAVAAKAWDYARYYLHAPAWFPKQLVVVNRQALIGLPRASRDRLLSAADAGRERAWPAAEAETTARIQNLRDRGIRVRTPGVNFLIALEELGRELLFLWSDGTAEEGAALVEGYYRIK